MSRRNLLVLAIAAIIIAAFPVTVGCARVAEEAAERAVEDSTGVEIDADDGSVTIEGEDGSEVTVSEDGQLPDGFPTDVPVSDGEITATMKSGDTFTVGIETPDDHASVLEWYRDRLEGEGWTITTDLTVEDGGMLTAEKGDQALQVTVGAGSSGESETVVTLITGPK